jgi:Replication initiator protein A
MEHLQPDALLSKPPTATEAPLGKEANGYDEMNLAEFAVARLTDRTEKASSIEFTDKVWDASRNCTITRTLKITPSAEFGFPTPLDDELLLGLVQITKDTFGGAIPKEPVDIEFSRYRLLKTLGWKDTTANYKRIEESINRWIGVTLYYDNAWWDKESKAWVNEKFHFIEHARIVDAREANRVQQPLFKSSFRWNHVIWRSFRSGNLKGIDFERYKKLDSSIAKRLYRFLDKRFYRRKRWEFDLAELTYEHIGLSRSYDSANLKRKLTPAILELEHEKFLAPRSPLERFRKVKAGAWDVIFEAFDEGRSQVTAQQPTTVLSEGPTVPISIAIDGLLNTLVSYGVSQSTAEDLLKSFPAEKIATQIEVFDWKRARNDKSISQNPPGYLVSAIRGDYAKPPGFVSRKSTEEKEAALAQKEKRRMERLLAQEMNRKRQEEEKQAMLSKFWEGKTVEDRRQLEIEAISKANEIERDILARGSAAAEVLRTSLLERFALEMLSVG